MVSVSALKILQITDLHILPQAADTLMGINTEFYWRAVWEQALHTHPDADLIILSGDLCQQPCIAGYRRILDRLLKTSIRCICLPGNHDDYALMQHILNQENVSCNKQVIFEHWQIISLNSQLAGKAGGFLPDTELNFIDRCIERHPNLRVLLTFHHHCSASGSAWMDTMQIANRDTLFQKLRQHPQIRAVTTGHVHQQIQTQNGAIKIFSTPSTCFQFKPFSPNFALDTRAPGYRWFRLWPDGKIDTAVERLPVELTELDLSSNGY